MKKVLEKRKDIAFYIKLFPLPMHKEAYPKSKEIVCSADPLKSLDDVFAHKELPKTDCPTTQIDDNLKLGQKLGINGTPAIIMPNGTLVSGALDSDALIKQIDQSSASAK
jgi:protein-disulfide isomerase